MTEYLIQLRQPPLPVPEPQPGLSGPFTIPALTFHNYFISLIFPMAGSAPGGPHFSPSSIRQSLTPSALLSPPILVFAGSLTVSPLLSLLHTHHMHAHTITWEIPQPFGEKQWQIAIFHTYRRTEWTKGWPKKKSVREKGGPQNFTEGKWNEKLEEFKYSSIKTLKKMLLT